MKLYFKTKPNANGNSLQLVIDTETNTAQKGFFLFGFSVDAVYMDKKQLEKLFEQVENERIFGNK
jgi:hypothetical protein